MADSVFNAWEIAFRENCVGVSGTNGAEEIFSLFIILKIVEKIIEEPSPVGRIGLEAQ